MGVFESCGCEYANQSNITGSSLLHSAFERTVWALHNLVILYGHSLLIRRSQVLCGLNKMLTKQGFKAIEFRLQLVVRNRGHIREMYLPNNCVYKVKWHWRNRFESLWKICIWNRTVTFKNRKQTLLLIYCPRCRWVFWERARESIKKQHNIIVYITLLFWVHSWQPEAWVSCPVMAYMQLQTRCCQMLSMKRG